MSELNWAVRLRNLANRGNHGRCRPLPATRELHSNPRERRAGCSCIENRVLIACARSLAAAAPCTDEPKDRVAFREGRNIACILSTAPLGGMVTRTRRRPPRLTLGSSPRWSRRQSVERETPSACVASSIAPESSLTPLLIDRSAFGSSSSAPFGFVRSSSRNCSFVQLLFRDCHDVPHRRPELLEWMWYLSTAALKRGNIVVYFGGVVR